MTAYVQLQYLDLEPLLRSVAQSPGREASMITLRWLLSRLADEEVANLAPDHFHPEVAAPLQALHHAIVSAMERAGVDYLWATSGSGS